MEGEGDEVKGELVKQGAEAKLYKTQFLGRPAILKVRFSKGYRHPQLDKQLTKRRLKAEVKGLERCKNLGIRTPVVYLVDNRKSTICMELLENVDTVDVFITKLLKVCRAGQPDTTNLECTSKLKRLAQETGATIGKMHAGDIIHGDLTTSNILVGSESDAENAEITLIDFGLSSMDHMAEDKGVDLYVLERALLSTHSSIPWFFEFVLESYKIHNTKDAADVLKKLDEIRLRGRKRTMIG